MAKQIIRLTESELHKVIMESVRSIINEDGWMKNASKSVAHAKNMANPTVGQRVGTTIDNHNSYLQKVKNVIEPITRTAENGLRTFAQKAPGAIARRAFGVVPDVAERTGEQVKNWLSQKPKDQTAGSLIKHLGKGGVEGIQQYGKNMVQTPEFNAVTSATRTYNDAVEDYNKHGRVHPVIGAN